MYFMFSKLIYLGYILNLLSIYGFVSFYSQWTQLQKPKTNLILVSTLSKKQDIPHLDNHRRKEISHCFLVIQPHLICLLLICFQWLVLLHLHIKNN